MKFRTLLTIILGFVSCLVVKYVLADDFSCPPGLAIKRGQVPHPWFDDIPVPSAWCIDKAGKKNGPWWGWDPETKTILFRVNTLNGEPHGVFSMYYTNGKLAEKGSLSRGKRIGDWVTYNPDGTIKAVERR